MRGCKSASVHGAINREAGSKATPAKCEPRTWLPVRVAVHHGGLPQIDRCSLHGLRRSGVQLLVPCSFSNGGIISSGCR
jgi:hypothetical protein